MVTLDPTVTVTEAVPLVLPALAATVNGPPVVLPAVNRPAERMVPPPLTHQLNHGAAVIGAQHADGGGGAAHRIGGGRSDGGHRRGPTGWWIDDQDPVLGSRSI